MEYILWLHIVTQAVIGSGYDSVQVLAHPQRFSNYEECMAVGEEWTTEQLKILESKRYGILISCESTLVPPTTGTMNSLKKKSSLGMI